MNLTTHDKKFFGFILTSLIVTGIFNVYFGAGMLYTVIMFGIGSAHQKKIQSDLNFFDSADDLANQHPDDGPGEEDGSWAKGFETRCSRETLEEAFRRGKTLTHFIRDEVE